MTVWSLGAVGTVLIILFCLILCLTSFHFYLFFLSRSFVVASANLSMRRAEVEEKRDKVHKESNTLLDYTRKAINKHTELKK